MDAGGFPRDKVVFEVALALVSGPVESLEFITQISGKQIEDTCAGTINRTSCYLVSAIAEYPIIIDSGVISFKGAVNSPRIVARANNTAITKEIRDIFHNDNFPISEGLSPSTLGGIAGAGNSTSGPCCQYSMIPIRLGELSSLGKHTHLYLPQWPNRRRYEYRMYAGINPRAGKRPCGEHSPLRHASDESKRFADLSARLLVVQSPTLFFNKCLGICMVGRNVHHGS